MPNAEPTLESAASKITPLFILQFCVVIIVILIVVFRPGEWTSARWVGLCIAIPSAVLLFTARWQLGRSFSVTPQARKLVTHGVYSKIRNPIYVFGALLIFGFLLALQKPQLFLVFLIVIPMQIIRAQKEAQVLEGKFGDAYRQYKRS